MEPCMVVFLLLGIVALVLSIVAITMARGARDEVIVALTTAKGAQDEVRKLHRWLAQTMPGDAAPAPPVKKEAEARPEEAADMPESSPVAEPAPMVAAVDVTEPAPATTEGSKQPAAATASDEAAWESFEPIAPAAPKQGKGMLTEAALGGKVASFVGIGMLLIGVAFLIGYAIKNALLGPEARIVLGLLCGAVLVVLGHLAEVRGRGLLHVLARALTGGGTAIFYFCVFAAYGIYELIPASLAAVGLVACAAAALGLAMAYRSQAVAVIGVIGAFLMPLLISSNDPNIPFLLTYIALINFPVIALGVYRNWQILYNLAFGFTVFFMGALIVSRVEPNDERWLLVFTLVYFLQFASLGLIKLRCERSDRARAIDISRLVWNSLGLLGVLYVLLQRMELEAWTGAALVAGALIHVGFARIGWRWFPSFTYDILAYLFGALTLVSLALPMQLDGAWVSAGWSIEGALLCWLALRSRIKLLQGAAFVLGMTGLLKALTFDVQFYDVSPTLFLNARFMTGLLSAVLLGVQGHLHNQYATREGEQPNDWWKILIPLATLAVLAVFVADLFWTLGEDDIWAWVGSGVVLMAVAMVCTRIMSALPLMADLTRGLLVLTVASFAVNVLAWAWLSDPEQYALFLNLPFVALAAMMVGFAVVMPAWLGQLRDAGNQLGSRDLATALNLGSLAAGVLLVTMEIYRMTSEWDQVLVTIWWAGCAIALVMGGMIRRRPGWRYAGLALFALMTAKVLMVDLTALHGLERVAASMGAGVLLLILSFVYQRAAERLAREEVDS